MSRSCALADLGLQGEGRGFLIFSFEEKCPDLSQCAIGEGIVVVGRTARPERLFIQLDPFAGYISIYHRAERSVAQG